MSEPRAHRTDIQVRFGDTDALGHLNNTAYAVYAELARVEFARSLGTPERGLILARLAIDFRRQVHYGDRVHVLTHVERIGTTSITFRQRILANDHLAADAQSVIVVFDYAAQTPAPIPDDLRSRLEEYALPAG